MVGRVWKGLLVGTLMVGVLAGCGDDDEETASGTTTATSEAGGAANTLDIEMIDYGYKVTGKLSPGLATITSSNTGDEFHMAGFGKLKAGKTLADVTEALKAMGEGGGPGGGGPEGGGPEGGEGAGAGGGGQQGAGEIQAASLSQEGGGGGQEGGPEGGGGGEGGGGPLAEFLEKELGTPGHLLQPGASQSLTVDVLDEGTYVMLCFLPTEGEGTPHLAKGMVSSFEVRGKASKAEAPEADATITLGDEADPTGVPTDLAAGEHTVKVTASGSKGKDFTVVSLKPGKELDAFEEFFDSEFGKEGGPAKGLAKKAPGTIYASTFEIEPGQSIWVTVDIPSGETYFVGTTNSEEETVDGVDKFVKVNVT